MRQLIIQVPKGQGNVVLDLAKSHNGVNLAQFEASNNDGEIDVVIVNISNRKVEKFLGELEDLSNVHISLMPTGVIALQPPASEAPQQVKDVQERSPIEIFLSGLQSIGSWRGFLGYAALAGVVVWIGLYTNTSYLLVAAMLIAPFAGPAMNVAIATARGDRFLLWRSLLRYFSALGVTILITFFLSLILQQKIPTSLMIDRSQISAVAVLLPIAAGAAGALNLVQSERSSLVSGAATGMLVAASLAPPAGIVGMACAIGRWDLAKGGLFLLLLQLCGINLTAAILFRIFGLSTKGSRYDRGKKGVFPIALSVTLMALLGLLGWQFSTSPSLERSTRAQRANVQVQKAIEEVGLAELIESNVRFTRPEIPGQNTLLSVVYVQRKPGVKLSDAVIRQRITRAVQNRLEEEGFNLTSLVSVNVLEP
ncbi:TIGR00341 family protein [[Phormidium ambiguum] IAM M-71]|uniref:TIGR00341 family protein n=1 Tax=[Phormidium ambiguum] IAM M-71 TaxID=454136 RepID=A0A1U7IMS6_9CYAN|nr:TIGR00341 family protein [Phormidium ambiguum]OKH38654.1 TIGR00341 family protein [Phormidium ambiguum IAM M-71]